MDDSNQQMPQNHAAPQAAPTAPIGGEEKKSKLKVILPIVAAVVVIAVIIWLAA